MSGVNSPWSGWINEKAIVRPGIPRLSGIGISHVPYIATASDSHFPAVSTTKGGLTSLL